jgi:hypothetical protein
VSAPTFRPPTLEDVLSAQNDLASLCAEREFSTSEIFSANGFYGLDRVLKLYAGVDPNHPLKMVIPHGIEMDDTQFWKAEAHTPLPMVSCAPREVRKYTQQTDKVAIPNATPFVYVCGLLDGSAPPERSGTLFFLAHSTHRVTARSPLDDLAERLLALGEEFQPVSVCVYWRDYMLGHHLPFERRGLRIVSSGHMYDPLFLFRLYRLCSAHRYACSNELGSHVFYTVKAGCSFFLLGEAAAYEFEHSQATADVTVLPSAIRARLQNLFQHPLPQASAEQLALVDDFTGANHRLSPTELRELIRFADKLDLYGLARWQGKAYRARPQALRRALWLNPKARVRRWGGALLRGLGVQAATATRAAE